MYTNKDDLISRLEELKESGLYKRERFISSPQGVKIAAGNFSAINLCANNYLGLAQHPEVKEAAMAGLEKWGYGLASVRFICGTQEIHKELEANLSEFLKTEDTILYSSCFDANGGVFECLLGAEDAIFSDELNHASIIDGIRLCKAKRFPYKNNNMEDLEAKLKSAQDSKVRLIVTDGVFSMDGYIANLKGICDLAEKYGALVMVDDCHSTGFMGDNGRGTPEHCGVLGRVDILSGTLGKALGGASGGYVSGRKEIVEYLRQRSRPYLFSNTIAPPIVTGSLKALQLVQEKPELRKKLKENSEYFRTAMEKEGFNLLPGEHPIAPVMIGDASLATKFADMLLEQGVFVIGFSFPVVPKGAARIRTQMSAAHTKADLEMAVAAFAKIKNSLGF